MSARLSVDTREIRRLESQLRIFNEKGLPHANRSALNSGAFLAQKVAKLTVKQEMVLRNAYTLQQIQVERAQGMNIKFMESRVGSTQQYMAHQEFGHTKVKKGKEGVAIPTSYSAGLGLNAKPRTKLPRKPNKLQNIMLQRKAKVGKTRKLQNWIAVKMAIKTGRRYVYLDLGTRKAILKITGGKRKPIVRMVHDLTRQSVKINPKPWLAPSVDVVKKQMPRLYLEALQYQRDRLKIFRHSF